MLRTSEIQTQCILNGFDYHSSHKTTVQCILLLTGLFLLLATIQLHLSSATLLNHLSHRAIEISLFLSKFCASHTTHHNHQQEALTFCLKMYKSIFFFFVLSLIVDFSLPLPYRKHHHMVFCPTNLQQVSLQPHLKGSNFLTFSST